MRLGLVMASIRNRVLKALQQQGQAQGQAAPAEQSPTGPQGQAGGISQEKTGWQISNEQHAEKTTREHEAQLKGEETQRMNGEATAAVNQANNLADAKLLNGINASADLAVKQRTGGAMHAEHQAQGAAHVKTKELAGVNAGISANASKAAGLSKALGESREKRLAKGAGVAKGH